MNRSISNRGAWALAALAGVAAAPSLARAEEVVAITNDGRVITFDTATPGTLTGNRVMTGIVGNVVAIDVRPADGVLFAVTADARLYRLDAATGAAVAVGPGTFGPSLGSFTGMDFVPGSGQIRIVNDLNANLRISAIDGSLVDGDPVLSGSQQDTQLAYAASDVNFGTDPTVVALASDGAATVYGIDSTLDTLVTLSPPSQGTLQTIGALGVLIGSVAGFDVSPATSGAFAVLTLQGQSTSGLYNVNLATGGVTFAGTVGYPTTVRAMAVGPTSSVVPITSRSLVGLTQSGELIRFRSDAPATINGRVAVTGLVSGDTLLALDTRPSNGRLYGLGSGGRIYVINATTGLATPIRTAPFEIPLAGTAFGFDFHPSGSRIRIVSNQGQNLRVDPDSGAVVDADGATAGVQADGPLAFAQGDVNQGNAVLVVSAAYDANETTGGASTLFVIDSGRGVLVRQGSVGGAPEAPNSGALHTIGSLGVNTSNVMGFEIAGDSTAFASFAGTGGSARLYSVDLTTGIASLIDVVGVSETLRDLAVAPTSNPAAPGADLAVENLTIRFDYARPDRDSVAIDAIIPLPSGTLEGAVVLIDVGGYSKSFTLGRLGTAKNDESTRSRKDDDRFAFAVRPRDGHLRFTTRIRREDLSDELTDEGMGGTEDARRAPRTVQLTVTVSGEAYTIAVPLRFTAKAGKTGVATIARN